jgi:SAM-dependent methyltransferase
MRAQRSAHLPAAIDATAEQLPFPDNSFDAAMTTFSVHQWNDLTAGLREMRRVTRGPVVVLTCDPDLVRDFWLYEYAPLVLDAEARRYPAISDITKTLGGHCTVEPVPIPADCTDGFNEAYYARPERLLDPGARQACSAWSFVEPDVGEQYAQALRRDLASGAWDQRHGSLRQQPYLNGSLVLIRATPATFEPAPQPGN